MSDEIKVGYADCDNVEDVEERGLGYDFEQAIKEWRQQREIYRLQDALVTLQKHLESQAESLRVSLELNMKLTQDAIGWKQAFNEMRTIAVDRLSLILKGQALMKENLNAEQANMDLQTRTEQWLNQ